MLRVTVIKRDGSETAVKAVAGGSLMEAIRDAGELLALCGGSAACATCHVHIDGEWSERVGGAGVDEEVLLGGSPHYQANSRLSCQIKTSETLDGLRVTVPPED